MGRFTRRQRLTHPSQFRRVFAAPMRYGDRHVTVLARDNGLPYGRLGLAVGRRKIARATARNTFKRVVRESFRARQQQIQGYDVVVLPKPAAASATRAQLRASIDRQWGLLARHAGQA